MSIHVCDSHPVRGMGTPFPFNGREKGRWLMAMSETCILEALVFTYIFSRKYLGCNCNSGMKKERVVNVLRIGMSAGRSIFYEIGFKIVEVDEENEMSDDDRKGKQFISGFVL
ncbi:hypothetical protein CEXT_278661 [Caerostris extrusa]|uniref:Uncharacterized protein n=1 Tax=Caerostris extrusa TaxID=172846 RepID=A0AAV4MEP3_CAEEX|nr:hypothetical protein CEXT_278661 [Caerostris extrusa]